MNFEELYKTDISKHIEKKGKFSYLSWPYAVAEFRKACPKGTWIIADYNGQPYCKTDAGCFVQVTVYPDLSTGEGYMIHGQGFTQIHPVLNHQNKPISEPNAFDINTSIQRCLVKAIALATGIGLHIYAGEDLPTDEPNTPPPKKATPPRKALTLNEYMEQALGNTTYPGLTAWYKENLSAIRADLGQDGVTAITEYCGELKQEMDAINAG